MRRPAARLRVLPAGAAPAPHRRDPNGPGFTVTLRRSPFAVLDRWLPARPGPFVGVVLAIAAGTWGLAGLLAADGARFLASREWQVQPLYLAVHLGLLRAFTSVYASNFVAGAGFLTAPRGEAEARVRRALGWRSVVLAAAAAAPLVALDVAWMRGAEYAGARAALGAGGALGATDALLAGVWALEWTVNAYVWALIAAFLLHSLALLRRREFRDPVERVLREKQYRPFLLMNAQGASLTVVLAAASFAYVQTADGVLSDHVGLWVTAALVAIGFVPPWLVLKSRVGRVVAAEVDRLSAGISERSTALDAGAPAASTAELAARVDLALAILRVEHLDRLHDELGKSEAQGIVLKLVAPAFTGVFRVIKPF
jgi:hypothetical protein